MTDYVVTGGASSNYPSRHYGAHFVGTRATFCIDADFAGLSANVLAIPGLSVSLLTASPITVAETFFGIHVQKRVNDRLTGVTGKTMRSHDANLRWKEIETSAGVFSWTNLDLWVDTHYAAGRDLVFTLFGTPSFHSARSGEIGVYGAGSPGLCAEPTDITKWSTFCTQVATRYLGKIKYYEVWNEPNLYNDGTGIMRKDYYGGAVDATLSTDFFFSGTFAKLSEMTRRANQAIKAVDPTAKIICPAVQGWTTVSGKSDAYFTGMMAASSGDAGITPMKDWVDIVGVHLYLSANKCQDLPAFIDRVIASKTAAAVSGLETWDTESAPIGTGLEITTMSDVRGQAIIGRMMIIMAAKGIARTMYYQYDHGTMGIVTRPGVVAYREHVCQLLRSGAILRVHKFTDGRIAYSTSSGVTVI